MEAKTVSATLLEWYDRNRRTLPWRAKPGEGADPYRVWLSEVMLQQTTTAHAAPYFERFTARWPTIDALAAAPEEAIMTEWAGLGYYSRARNLVACARAVAERGGFPEDEAGLRALPGIGEYTAAAISAIAFRRRAVPVDANIERVVARLFAIEEPLPGAKKAIRAAAERVVPTERAGDFAQAAMDLGATICTPRDPKCLLCPVNDLCEARARGIQGELPRKAAKKARPLRAGTAFWIEQAGKVWLVRRPGKGLLGGMLALPDDGWSARVDGTGEAPLSGAWRGGGVVRHTFTHFELELGVAIYAGGSVGALDGGEWWATEKLETAGLPTLFAKAARLALT